jgi:DNA (cytosine-5)-methyltransferase 1
MTLTVGSLFSGIGGLDLGLERAGMTVRWQVEIDAWCRRVLAKHWPDVTRYADIKTIDWTEVEPVDLVCGGFPCQPVSLAGKRLAQDDPRWLWPEFARCLRALRPRFALMENVPGLLSAGMGDVLGDLAALGYDAEWDCIPAAAVGAPHLRYRILIVADSESMRRRPPADGATGQWVGASGQDVAHPQVFAQRPGLRPDDPGGERGRRPGDGGGAGEVPDAHGFVRDGRTDQPWRGPERRTALGWDSWWATEPSVGRVAHGVPSRVDRLRGLGNAVVPQVAEWIGRRIMEAI